MYWRDQRVRIALACTVVAILAIAMCGCASVDQFGSRATTYNDQTADSKSSNILLNVVRAAYSQPLQFTDVTTVAGTASLSGTASGSIPIPLNHPALIAARTATASVSATGSGTNTVNVANLNTQEFYSGLQTPLSMQQVAFYLSGYSGLDNYELLPLFISDIDLISNDGTKISLHNAAENQGSFGRFYTAMKFLIDEGLDVEQAQKKKPTKVGPVLTVEEAKDPKILSALVAGSNSSTTTAAGQGGLTLSPVTKQEDKKTTITGYQLEKGGGDGESGKYRFCFRDTKRPIENFSISKPPKRKKTYISLGREFGRPKLIVPIGQQYYCGAKPALEQSSDTRSQKAGQGITLKTRSLEGIFYFLGEMVRTELGLANGEGTSLAIPLSRETEFHLFRVERRLPSVGEPWVTYNGETYTIGVDPSGQRDASSRIIQLLTDLLALQSSAKNLPAPNLITITTP